MTPAEKKRFFWVMVLILFFFANLITGTILVFNVLYAKPVPPVKTSPPASAPSTQP